MPINIYDTYTYLHRINPNEVQTEQRDDYLRIMERTKQMTLL